MAELEKYVADTFEKEVLRRDGILREKGNQANAIQKNIDSLNGLLVAISKKVDDKKAELDSLDAKLKSKNEAFEASQKASLAYLDGVEKKLTEQNAQLAADKAAHAANVLDLNGQRDSLNKVKENVKKAINKHLDVVVGLVDKTSNDIDGL